MPFSGVDEQSFVLPFAVGVVIAAAVAQVWRILALSHSARDARPSTIALRPVEAAYLAGGRRPAFTVAVASLRSAELASLRHPMPAGVEETGCEQEMPLGPVEAAILKLKDSAGTVPRGVENPLLRQAYFTLEADLQRRGLLLTRRQRAWIAMACLPLAIVTGSGVLLLAYRPDYALLAAVLAAGVILVGLLLRVPRGTRLGMTLTRTPDAGVGAGSDQLWGWQSMVLDNQSLAG